MLRERVLRAADPVKDPLGLTNQGDQLKYVDCMRANGVPNYPYPQGNSTDFQGTGVDPTSPSVENVNKLCGKRIGAPAWWIAGTGPPGDVVVTSAGINPNGGPPPCPNVKEGCTGNAILVPAAGG